MKAVEEPACLTVGTDVSAKYRGAFCEAKIKTVKRLVKVKVTLKAEGTSQVVHDDQVKGQLRVGAVVEVKLSEGGSSEAVISKLTDASLYTVVFDDGDEKTLRRTSLCLKGERHFAESETLDQLPLTNPEHFGTPVIGKKSNRGRRSSQAVADEENESSSSDEEEEERRVSDELLGKVCSIEGQDPALILVVSPVCNEELAVKKDHCLVRSFGDGKFSTILRRSLTALSPTSFCNAELCHRKGADAAQSFLRSGEVPEVWKMDLTQILESSSDSDDKPSEGEPENEEELKKKSSADFEPEEEADPEERDHFLQQLYKFMEDRGTPINKPPVLGYKDLNLFKLFRLVTRHGGCSGIESGTVWKQIYTELGIPVLNSAAAYNVKTAYRKYLFGFEEYCRSALITFRTIHHNNPRPPASQTNQRPPSEPQTDSPANHRAAAAEQKGSPASSNQRAAGADLKDAVKTEAESESDSDHEREELLTSPRGRRRCVLPLKDEQRDARKRTPRQNDQSERPPRLGDQSERGGRLTDQSERGSEDEEDEEEEEEEEPLLNPTEGCDSDPDSDSLAGTRVRVKYGRGKTQKIYEAHIKKIDIDNGENFYLVHYYGWNVRYDEWVKADRIIWPSEKGSKKKKRGKLKNKDEPDREDECPLKEERPPKGPGRRGRPLGSKNKTNGRPAERREPGIANGDNTPRRRTRRTSGMFDSDRASNVSAEDSGNSSDDSESEDSVEKKPFPWRQAEAGLKQEAESSPKQEEKEEGRSETTPPSETTAPTMPQDTTGQSQQRVEPEPVATPEGKSESSPKLKLPRSEPMVLLHHCLPPDSDTDSASESDSEREEAAPGGQEARPAGEEVGPGSEKAGPGDNANKEDGEDGKGDAKGQEQDSSEDRKDERVEESAKSPHKTARSPLRDGNASAKSPSARSPSARSPNARSPNAQNPSARSPNARSPSARSVVTVRSPPRERLLGEKKTESEVAESPLRPDKTTEETSPKPQPNHALTAPDAEGNRCERTPTKRDAIRPQGSPKPERNAPQSSPKPERHASPKPERNTPQSSPKRERSAPQSSPKRERSAPQSSPKPDRNATENSPRRERIQPENSPKRDRIQAESCPAPSEEEPSAERSEAETTPLKRKAAEQKTPDKKLKTDTETTSPKTTNMAAVEEEGQKAEEEPGCEERAETEKVPEDIPEPVVENVPEMGADALVCHEVDLDEPEDREKVSASEQLMLMREGHLLRAPPPAPIKGPPPPAKATPPPQVTPQQNETPPRRREEDGPGDRGQKRVLEGPHSPTVKKHKRPSHKRLTPNKPDKNGHGNHGHSSDSEDQSRVSLKSHKHCPSPTTRGHKWTLHIDDLENMSSAERISFLQEKLQEIRKYYLSLKSEVASIDRRRKRLKKKEREVSNPASASSSSDTAMSPSSSSPSQSSLAVEVR